MELEREKRLDLAFYWSLLIKGFFALVEIFGGIIAYFVSQEFLYDLAATVTQNEITADPNDFFANYVLRSAENFSIGAQHFTATYLILHGVTKLFLITGLLKRITWAFPTSLVVFTLFIMYQLYRYSVTLSPWLVAVSIFDLFVIGLILYEYHRMRRKQTLRELG